MAFFVYVYMCVRVCMCVCMKNKEQKNLCEALSVDDLYFTLQEANYNSHQK